ncbi:putative manganese transporter [Vibrio hippocampi]|uniref:Manganese transporter 11 TMS n=1 Tax=Vibrio hippocampi TaxID=654686 RepID=A0ABM8ZHB9_9VIBR|nr:putative manganese transporter [Vibrio hippocampi]CAH0526092.1 hypothetical protein VHP8226_01577 [Vibrio hippocampi]
MTVFSKQPMTSRTLTVNQFQPAYKRLLLPVCLIALLATDSTRDLVVNSLSDAFWAVSTYVAFTLVVYHYLSAFISSENKLASLYRNSRHYQVFFAALLGALPGCGGAIVVTTQFVSGRVGFGAIVAVLTSTMGDAAFLLLASQPDVGLGVVALGVVVGWLTGCLVNALHADDFLRPPTPSLSVAQDPASCDQQPTENEQKAINVQGEFWRWIMLPTLAVALLGSFQVDVNALLSLPEMTIEWAGTVMIVGSMLLWSLTREIKDYQSTVSEDNKPLASHPFQKAAQDTNFITAWVIVGFLAFELITHFAQINITQSLSGWGIWMPFLGMMVGLLPGCGPQILVTSLYLSGAVPMSAQLSNAISNDGDALFPAIAMAPKAALVATFYSALPALVVGYGYYWIFE